MPLCHASAALEVTRAVASQWSSLLYSELRIAIGQDRMVAVTAQENVGLHLNTAIQCDTDDGPTALFCIFSKYSKCESYTKDDIEARFNSAWKHFETGSPAYKIQFLRPHLKEAIRMGIKLKANMTIIPILEALSNRGKTAGMKFSQALTKWDEGGSDPDNCSA